MNKERIIPKEFFWRRMHSLAGLWLIFFIIEHLLTNSQSALLFGDDGRGFIRSVNFLHSLPYLPAIEILLLGVPFLVHGLWGLKYANQAKFNSFPSDGTKPALGMHRRNHGFTWQRITSWILAVGVVAHVVHMRFVDYPEAAAVGAQSNYIVRVGYDPGLETLSERLGFEIFTQSSIEALDVPAGAEGPVAAQRQAQEERFLQALDSMRVGENDVAIVASSFGTATLMVVRDTFKSPLMIILYALFVIAAGYHAFYGLWTWFITWGFNITDRSQGRFFLVTNTLMIGVTFLGLASVFLTYLNLRS
jgi:succinate dehydrogenase / fumarate reductase, cytochrome b subunit